MKLRIGTRASALALTQTRWVAGRISALNPGLEVELVEVRTSGDANQTTSLVHIGAAEKGQGVFVRELQERLLAGEVDLAVHSLKDLPTEGPSGLVLVATPEREDPRDVLIVRDGAGEDGVRLGSIAGGAGSETLADGATLLARLPRGARVGTGSPRRVCQLAAARPDVTFADVRGNVDTRLRKLAEGQFEAIVLAAAGLRRLGLGTHARHPLPVEVCTPAVGQGALGLEARAGDARTAAALAPLHHAGSQHEVDAERAFLATLGGGCAAPVGALGRARDGVLVLRGAIGQLASHAGRGVSPEIVRGELSGPFAEARSLGARLAEKLLAAGGRRLLDEARGASS